jgi:hypothetical protein
MIIGTCILEINLPGAHSLKDKRSIIKGITARVHSKFNVSCAEIGLHDAWGSTTLGLACISTSAAHAEHMLERVAYWIEQTRPDIEIIEHRIEIIR